MQIVRKATEADLSYIKQLIQEAGLDDAGVEKGLEHFFVVEDVCEWSDSPHLVGTVGMEVYPPYGLLRSFVLKKEAWNVKISLRMMEILLRYASDLSLKKVYLFARETTPFFSQMGFSKISPEELPSSIVRSQHGQRMGRQGIPMMFSCSNSAV